MLYKGLKNALYCVYLFIYVNKLLSMKYRSRSPGYSACSKSSMLTRMDTYSDTVAEEHLNVNC